MPTEVSGANILTEILDLIFWHQMNVDTVTQCLDRITDEMMRKKDNDGHFMMYVDDLHSV